MPLRVSGIPWLTDEELAQAKKAYAAFAKRAAKLPKEWKAQCFKDMDWWYAEFYCHDPETVENNISYYERAEAGAMTYLDYVDFVGRITRFRRRNMACQSGCLERQSSVNYGHDYSVKKTNHVYYPKSSFLWSSLSVFGATRMYAQLCPECMTALEAVLNSTEAFKQRHAVSDKIRRMEVEHFGRQLPKEYEELCQQLVDLCAVGRELAAKWLEARKEEVRKANEAAGATAFNVVQEAQPA